MYSAQFCKRRPLRPMTRRAIGKGKSALKTALTKADRGFLEARRAVTKLAPRGVPAPTEPPTEDLTQQTSLLDTGRSRLPAAGAFAGAGWHGLFARATKELLPTAVQPAGPSAGLAGGQPGGRCPRPAARALLCSAGYHPGSERYDAHFVTQLTARGSELEWELLCLDPAPFVDASLAAGRAAALFSATLTPPGYRSVLGCPDARAVALESPFPPERGLYCLPGISTRYRDREASVSGRLGCAGRTGPGQGGQLSGLFSQLCLSAAGARGLHHPLPGHRDAGSGKSLDDAARAAFLEQFGPSPAKTLLGFGVMGGIFGEGVDLVGDRLIGCAIVGVGLLR